MKPGRAVLIYAVLTTTACASLPQTEYRGNLFVHRRPDYTLLIPPGWRPMRASDVPGLGYVKRMAEWLNPAAQQKLILTAQAGLRQSDGAWVSPSGAVIVIRHVSAVPDVRIPDRVLTRDEERELERVFREEGGIGSVFSVKAVRYDPHRVLEAVLGFHLSVTATVILLFHESGRVLLMHLGSEHDEHDGYTELQELVRSFRWE